MKPKLIDLTVMVTRPQHQAEKLCQMISEQGAKVVRFPALAIEQVDYPSHDKIMAAFNAVEIVIFISANAVFYGMSLWQRHHSLWPTDCVTLAIGEATAQALQNYGLNDVRLPKTQYT
ncbi:MAG: uroporphyrinogen-III synthase, partial [Gammaproteobacteria bacterium]